MSAYRLVRANPSHCETVFQLSNQENVRMNSISPEPINWPAHLSWFKKAIEDPGMLFLIAEDDKGQFLGQIRIKADRDNHPLISISLIDEARGKGLARKVLRDACLAFFHQRPEQDAVYAQIQVQNIASVSAFSRAGFVFFSDLKIDGIAYTEMRFLNPKSDGKKNAN